MVFTPVQPTVITRTKSTAIVAEVELPKNSFKNKIKTAKPSYMAETGWVISTYTLYSGSAESSWDLGPGTVSLSKVAAGSNFVSEQDFLNSFNSAFNLVLNANILDKYKAEIDAALTQAFNSHQQYFNHISSSHSALALFVEVTGAGLGNGRSRRHRYVDVVEEKIADYCVTGAGFNTKIINATKSMIDARRSVRPGGLIPTAELITVSKQIQDIVAQSTKTRKAMDENMVRYESENLPTEQLKSLLKDAVVKP